MVVFRENEINALSAIFNKEEEEADALRPAQSTVVPRIGPLASQDEENEKVENKKQIDPQAIWTDDEIPNEHELPFLHDASDTRKRPEFEMLFKQKVSTRNMFSSTQTSSQNAEAILYKINFPQHQRSEIHLQVTPKTLSVQSSRLKLALYLPQTVDSDRGKATWDEALETLSVSLPIAHDPMYGGLLD